MTKKKAIEILNIQKEKIRDPMFRTHIWKTQTESYIKKFFGENSVEDKWIMQNGFANPDNIVNHEIVNARRMEMMFQFLDDCMETIENKGLFKKGNILQRIPDNWLIAIIPISIIGLLGIGTVWGKYLSDTQNIDLKHDLKECNSKLSTFSPTRNNSDTTTNNIRKQTDSTHE